MSIVELVDGICGRMGRTNEYVINTVKSHGGIGFKGKMVVTNPDVIITGNRYFKDEVSMKHHLAFVFLFETYGFAWMHKNRIPLTAEMIYTHCNCISYLEYLCRDYKLEHTVTNRRDYLKKKSMRVSCGNYAFSLYEGDYLTDYNFAAFKVLSSLLPAIKLNIDGTFVYLDRDGGNTVFKDINSEMKRLKMEEDRKKQEEEEKVRLEEEKRVRLEELKRKVSEGIEMERLKRAAIERDRANRENIEKMEEDRDVADFVGHVACVDDGCNFSVGGNVKTVLSKNHRALLVRDFSLNAESPKKKYYTLGMSCTKCRNSLLSYFESKGCGCYGNGVASFYYSSTKELKIHIDIAKSDEFRRWLTSVYGREYELREADENWDCHEHDDDVNYLWDYPADSDKRAINNYVDAIDFVYAYGKVPPGNKYYGKLPNVDEESKLKETYDDFIFSYIRHKYENDTFVKEDFVQKGFFESMKVRYDILSGHAEVMISHKKPPKNGMVDHMLVVENIETVEKCGLLACRGSDYEIQAKNLDPGRYNVVVTVENGGTKDVKLVLSASVRYDGGPVLFTLESKKMMCEWDTFNCSTKPVYIVHVSACGVILECLLTYYSHRFLQDFSGFELQNYKLPVLHREWKEFYDDEFLGSD